MAASDEELLRAGDPGSFELFYLRHVEGLLGFFAQRGADPVTAADLAAETFARALAGRARADAEARSWLFELAAGQLARAQERGFADRPTCRRLGIEARAGEDFQDRLRRELRTGAATLAAEGPAARRVRDLRTRPPRRPSPPPRRVVVIGLAVMLAAAAVAAAIVARDGGRDTARSPAPPRVAARIDLAENLGNLAPGFGSAWVADPSRGEVIRVGTRFHQTQAEIPAGPEPAVATGAGAVWALVGGADARAPARLLRIDPNTNRVTARARLRAPGGAPLVAVQVLGGAPWVVGLAGALEADPRTARVRRTVRLATSGFEPFAVIGEGGALWVLTRDQRLLRYDLRSGRLAGEVRARLPGATFVLPTPAGPVLLNRDGRIALADPRDGRLTWQRTAGTSLSGALLRTGDSLWVHVSDPTGSDRLLELDLRTGATRSTTRLPEFGVAGLARVGRELWLTTPDGKLVIIGHGS